MSSVARARAMDAACRDEKAARLHETKRLREPQTEDPAEDISERDLSAAQWAQIAGMKRLKAMREFPSWKQRPYGDLTDKQLEYEFADLLQIAREQDEEASHIALPLVGSTKKQLRQAVAKFTGEWIAADDEGQRTRSRGP
ncbi:hypothetical protein NJL88_26710 [Streptomyces sp. DK15]|uniref:hypothetical protein n=1 Tax=Streptomyces sp. DK15 TaxID=2957499 RepID=UPI0029A30F1D|nr:hypothetical protein [Streptomyces sp. DK15]MDX2393586.1 hypothetical protein [Streptomyces sp. DK15]